MDFQCALPLLTTALLHRIHVTRLTCNARLIVSPQAHSCFKKACMIAGLGHVRILPTRQGDDFALDPDTLRAAMQVGRGVFLFSGRAGMLNSQSMCPRHCGNLYVCRPMLRQVCYHLLLSAICAQADVEAGLLPFYTCVTIGTTSSCAVDPVPELAEVAQR